MSNREPIHSMEHLPSNKVIAFYMKRDPILARALWHRFERSFQLDNVLNSEALSLVKHKINCQIESVI